jgi:hypothetical protein
LVPEYVKNSDITFGFGGYALSYIDHATTLELFRYIRDAKIKSKLGKAFESFLSGIEKMSVDFEKATGGLLPFSFELNVQKMRKIDSASQSAIRENWEKVKQIHQLIQDLQKQLEAESRDFEGITQPSYSNFEGWVRKGHAFDSIEESLIGVKGILIKNKGDISDSPGASFLLSEYPYRITRKGDPFLKLKVSESLEKSLGALEWHPFVKVIGIVNDDTHLQVLAISAKTSPTIEEAERSAGNLFNWHMEVEETIEKIHNHQWLDIPGLRLSDHLIQSERAKYRALKPSKDPNEFLKQLERESYPAYAILSDRAKQGLSFNENEAECNIHEKYAYQLLLLKWIFSRNNIFLMEYPRFSDGAKKLEESLKVLKSSLTKNNISSRIPDEF